MVAIFEYYFSDAAHGLEWLSCGDKVAEYKSFDRLEKYLF